MPAAATFPPPPSPGLAPEQPCSGVGRTSAWVGPARPGCLSQSPNTCLCPLLSPWGAGIRSACGSPQVCERGFDQCGCEGCEAGKEPGACYVPRPWDLLHRLGTIISPFPRGHGQKRRQGEDVGPTVFQKKGADAAPGLHFGQVPASPRLTLSSGQPPSPSPRVSIPLPQGWTKRSEVREPGGAPQSLWEVPRVPAGRARGALTAEPSSPRPV